LAHQFIAGLVAASDLWSAESDNVKVERVFDKMAPQYDRSMLCCERFFLGHGRQWATSQASGPVREIAIETGLNLPAYPPDTKVVGVDISEGMVKQAHDGISDKGMADRAPVEVGDVQALNLFDDSFDTVVSTYAMLAH
jgi:ubiquinone/menaquinone biosynthesis C-methylase UbiE